MNKLFFLWALFAVLIAGLPLHGVVVSTAAELENAVGNANNGGDTTIVLTDGTYYLTDMLAIWADGVTVRSQSGNRDAVKIYGQGMTGGVSHIFNVAGTAFTAKDMTIGRVANHAIQIWGNNNSSDTLLSNLRIVDTYEQMVKISYDSSSSNRSQNGVMENCLLEYTAGVGPQYYIGGIDGHQTRNWTVRNNVFKHISSPSGDVAEHAVHFWSDSEGTLVENNHIIDCDRGIGFGLGGRGHSGGIIRNNMIYHGSTDHGFADVAIGLENASGAKVYNNTIYMANSYPYAIEYRFSGTSGGIIRNNLCNKAIVSRDGGSATLSNNITNAKSSWFTAVSSGDLHLASEVSQVVDQGIAISGLTTDFDGDSRPQGSGIDIGADEYVTGETIPTEEIVLGSSQLVFGAVAGGASSDDRTFSVANNAGGTMNWTVSGNASWLSVSPASGTNAGTVTVSVSSSGLSAGTYNGIVSVSSADASNSPQTVAVTLNVYSAGSSAEPFGEYATPANGAVISSSVPFTGWVLDDVGVESVKIYRMDGGTQVYIGDAIFVPGARGDVEAAYPYYPDNHRAGWGYMMLTNFLPNNGNGGFTIRAIAEDKEGHRVTLGARSVTVDNANAVKPFGAIDYPQPGATVSGSSYRNHGWALTPPPNEIPTDGSKIEIYIDSVSRGAVNYNIYRSDIFALFPAYLNSDGAGGYFDIDTTAYADGLHTIAWSVVDGAGNTDGIGSRYFAVQNTGRTVGTRFIASVPREDAIRPKPGPIDTTPVIVRKGFNRTAEPREIHPGEDGVIAIETTELQRLELHLLPDLSLPLTPYPFPLENAAPSGYQGYAIVGDSLQSLPIGSTLDPTRGVFSWQPGVGFVGSYDLLFIKKTASGLFNKTIVRINIAPKFSPQHMDSDQDNVGR